MSSTAASPSNSPPPPDLSGSDDEMDELMTRPMNTSPEPEPVSNPSNEDNAAASTTPSGTAASGSDCVSLHRVGIPRNELVAIRNAVKHARLHPYQQQEAEEHYTRSQAHRDTQLYITILSLHNKTEALTASAPAFTVNGPLLNNIKSFIVAVLLSSKLASYKGVCPRDHVLALVMRDRLHLPKTFDRDPSAAKTLKEAVNHELSQARSKLKRLILANMETNVYHLAMLLIELTSCTVSIPLCGRIALLRKVAVTDPGSQFWDAVDAQLKKLRKKATDKTTQVLNQASINQYFTNILDIDFLAHPTDNGAAIPTNLLPTNEWQLGVDSLIAGEPQASVPSPAA